MLRWIVPWASVLLISSAIAYGFNVAVITCCPGDAPHATAGSARRDVWHDGALSLTPPDRAADSRGGF
jgi:hypothetical protein